jgi:uncharacterized membrane protein YgdD (TMEM256/DUF423 family)
MGICIEFPKVETAGSTCTVTSMSMYTKSLIQGKIVTMTNDSCMLQKCASFLGATGVAFGAFGAHALKERLLKSGGTENWKTAVFYQLFHSVALLSLSAMQRQNNSTSSAIENRVMSSYERAGQLFGIGTVMFSGSIYLLTLEIGPKKLLGPTTPIGGILLMAGWVMVGFSR